MQNAYEICPEFLKYSASKANALTSLEICNDHHTIVYQDTKNYQNQISGDFEDHIHYVTPFAIFKPTRQK